MYKKMNLSIYTCWERTEFKPWHVYIDYLYSFKIKNPLLKNLKFKKYVKPEGPLLSLGSTAHVSRDSSFPIFSYPRNTYLWFRAFWLISFILMDCNDICTQNVSTQCVVIDLFQMIVVSVSRKEMLFI